MKNIVIALALTLSVLSLKAQDKFYYKEATAKGTNVTYVCERRNPFIVTIHNANNRYDDVGAERLDGTPIPFDERVQIATVGVLGEVISEALPQLSQQWFDDIKRPKIGYTIDTNGNVLEVDFMFLTESLWGTIPPDKFYLLEQKIKQRMKFALTDSQKKQNIVKAIF